MKLYDKELVEHQRVNFAGSIEGFIFSGIKDLMILNFVIILWNKGNFKTLFLKIWRLHEAQIHTLCELYFEKVWRVSKKEIELLINNKRSL